MEQGVSGSRGSPDSVSTNEEYEVISQGEPQLSIGGDGSIEDLKLSLQELLMDSGDPAITDKRSIKSQPAPLQQLKDCVVTDRDSGFANDALEKMPTGLENKCRADSLDTSSVESGCSPGDENKGTSARHLSLPLVSPETDSKVFNRVVYLGAATINAPRSQKEIQRNMAILNEQSSDQSIEVKLSIPSSSEGNVVLYESAANLDIASFKIHRIIFCARGAQGSTESSCFAFTCSHGNSAETAIFQCHVFKCEFMEDVARVLLAFSMAFSRIPNLRTNAEIASKMTESFQAELANEQTYTLDVTLEMKEEDLKGNFNSCPKDKNFFKLRCNLLRKVCLSVQQVCNNKELVIERCFGLLVSPGRNVKHGDMHLLEAVGMTTVVGERKVYTIVGNWDPTDPSFEVLNTETPKDTRVYMTVAVDLVIYGIQEPVRFVVETKAKIFQQNERFWYFSKRSLTEQFYLKLREVDTGLKGDAVYEVSSVECAGEIEQKRSGLLLNLRNPLSNWQTMLSPGDPDDESVSDNDEPLLSGSGDVSKDCTEDELESWADVLTRWRQNLKQRPRQLQQLVHKGIPEALRGEVWLLLAGCQEDADKLLETYRTLITKESPCEQVIQRDINRTFPAHDFFKESGGLGQDSLYKISKAYSIYDEEVGYCQGLSFLAASLLLHMPEEQAFCVLVKAMFDYQLRDLFKDNFEILHLKFYQLERLILDCIPDLHAHFQELGIEAHMFGSQWFLTLFTAKFPLFLVFHILDVFLCEGMDTIFSVSLALLMMSKRDLLALDFEGVLKYFRVSLPKKYRSEEVARQLMRTVVSIRIKKLKKYEKDFIAIKEQERQQEDPVKRFSRENKQLMQANMRLEQENDDLAYELVTSKINLRRNLDEVEDKVESFGKELITTKVMLRDTEEEKRRLETESAQVKEMCRRELERAESEITRDNSIIADYKQICSQLSTRLEKEQTENRNALASLRMKIKSCDNCRPFADEVIEKARRGRAPKSGQNNCDDMNADADLDGDDCLNDEGVSPRVLVAQRQIRELELELAQTKLALVEAECRNQDLTHQLNSSLTELQSSRNTWFQKTLTSIREVTKKEASSAPTSATVTSIYPPAAPLVSTGTPGTLSMTSSSSSISRDTT